MRRFVRGGASSASEGNPGGRGPGRRSSASLLRLLLLLACVTALGGLLLAHGHTWPVLHHHPNLLHTHAGSSSSSSRSSRGGVQLAAKPQGQLKYPLWWHAPFIAQSGLGTEALSIIEALVNTREMQAEDIYITHSGDAFDRAVLAGLQPSTRNLLARRQHPQQVADEHMDTLPPRQQEVQQRRLDDWTDTRPAIAVCMSWFDCWRQPGEWPSNMPGCPCPLSAKRTAFTVARTMFETAGLPKHLAEHAKAMDEIWVPSAFNVESFAAAGVNRAKIRVVPEGLDTDMWDPARFDKPIDIAKLNLQQATGPPAGPYSLTAHSAAFPAGHSSNSTSAGRSRAGKKPYVFLSVFKWEARKGWKELIEGFCRAFKPHDPVVLWILARPFLESGTDFDAKVRSYAAKAFNTSEAGTAARCPRIYTSSVLLGEADFVAVYRAVDALVVPTHGEGWGRPQIEAMAMQLPVITTNWSGPVAFINERVGYPLAITGLQLIRDDPDDPSFVQAFVGQRWAAPSVPHLVQLLRHVFTHPAEAAAKGRAARRHIQAHFTPTVVARVVAAEVRRLQGVIEARQRQQLQQQQQQQQLQRAARHAGWWRGGGATPARSLRAKLMAA